MIFLNKSTIYQDIHESSTGLMDKSDCKIQRKTEERLKRDWNEERKRRRVINTKTCEISLLLYLTFQLNLDASGMFFVQVFLFLDFLTPALLLLTFLVVCLKSALQQTLGFKKTLTVSITRKMTTTWIQNYSTARRKQEWMTSKGREGRKEAATRFQGRCWRIRKRIRRRIRRGRRRQTYKGWIKWKNCSAVSVILFSKMNLHAADHEQRDLWFQSKQTDLRSDIKAPGIIIKELRQQSQDQQDVIRNREKGGDEMSLSHSSQVCFCPNRRLLVCRRHCCLYHSLSVIHTFLFVCRCLCRHHTIQGPWRHVYGKRICCTTLLWSLMRRRLERQKEKEGRREWHFESRITKHALMLLPLEVNLVLFFLETSYSTEKKIGREGQSVFKEILNKCLHDQKHLPHAIKTRCTPDVRKSLNMLCLSLTFPCYCIKEGSRRQDTFKHLSTEENPVVQQQQRLLSNTHQSITSHWKALSSPVVCCSRFSGWGWKLSSEITSCFQRERSCEGEWMIPKVKIREREKRAVCVRRGSASGVASLPERERERQEQRRWLGEKETSTESRREEGEGGVIEDEMKEEERQGKKKRVSFEFDHTWHHMWETSLFKSIRHEKKE